MMTESDFDKVLKQIQGIDDRVTSESLHSAIDEYEPSTVLWAMKPDSSRRVMSIADSARKVQGLPTSDEEDLIYMDRAIVELEHIKLPSLPLLERHNMPLDWGVYFIRSKRGEVLYVGASRELVKRVCNKRHEAINTILPSSKETCTIEWYVYRHENLCKLETYCIKKFEPVLNTHGISGIKLRKKKAIA